MAAMLRLLLATRNLHKRREIAEILAPDPVEVLGLDAFPGLPEVEEDQATLEGNAGKKAREAARGSGLWALADDTGLEVSALGGSPGVLSARYAGPGCDYAANNRKLLAALAGVADEKRGAVFRTVMALADPRGGVVLEEGRLKGAITREPAGSRGFGYDPVFRVAARTLAEMTPEEKNALSHRAAALRKMLPHIQTLSRGLAAAGFLLVAAMPCRAGRTEPGQETIWDQIMAAQAHRGLRVGSRYLEEKRYDLAAREFERAVAANPKDPAAYMMMGVAQYWLGEVDRSLESYKKSLDLEADNAQIYMLVGISLAWKGETRKAHEAFLKAAQLDPNRADIQMNLGSIEDSLGNAQEALRRFRAAASLAPKEPLYHFQLGMLYRKLGRDQDASDSMRQALRFYSRFEDALLELGAIDERLGERKAAMHSFKKAVDLKSRDSVARFRLGRLYLLAGEPKKAREVFAEAFHLTPEEGEGLRLSVSYAGGKKGAAKKPEPSQAEPAPAPPPEDANDPLSIFARNLERVPLDQSALMQVDVVFVPRPKLVKASAESPASLRKALERSVGEAGRGPQAVRREYPLRKSTPEQRAEQIAKLLEDLRAVLAQAPEDADVRLGMNLNYTRLAAASQEGGGGRGDAEGSSKVSYQPRQVGNDMGLWIIGTGWMALVEEVLPEPGEEPSHPDQSDWWVADGLGHATLGDASRALASFERACGLDPGNLAAWLGRAVASVMGGNESGAANSLREALKLDPKNRAAGEGLKWLLRPSAGKKP